MNIDSVVRAAHAKRQAAGLVISFDRTTPEATTAYGRATMACATEQQRIEEFDRLNWLGRNPRVEVAA